MDTGLLLMFAELCCQSNFSFLHGASHPEELVSTAAFLGYEAIAITDLCSVAGVVRAYTEIKHNRLPLKLIVGARLPLEDLDLVALCPNKTAYAELCRVITNARRRANKGEFELSEWDLMTLKHCLFIWFPNTECLNSTHIQKWSDWLQRYAPQRAWIGAIRLLDGKDNERFELYNQLSARTQLGVCASNNALLHHPDRQPLQHILHAIRESTTVDKLGRSALLNCERVLRPANKLKKLFPEAWLRETTKIAQKCTFCLSELRYQYPEELVPEDKSAMAYLRECTYKGAEKRFPNGLNDAQRALIEKELALIEEQDYAYFFLTIYDIVNFAKSRRILYQGRGSAANSIVCYCLEITAVDPRKISLLFERFISKERDEPPDIDVDFEHQRREEVIQYIYQKYGRHRTALAATVITYRFKSAFREVGKALGIAESKLDYAIKNVNRRDRTQPWQEQILDAGLNANSQLIKTLITHVEGILGFPRHLSQHVGGFVISQGPLYELVPIENAAMADRTVIQWDKDDLESLALLKVDVLALGMLSAIRRAFDLIDKHYGYRLDMAWIHAQGDDRQVFDMLCKADSIGVFQVESRAQMSMLPRLKPRCYYDLVVQIAIVRPGPIQGDMVHPYLKRRDGTEKVSYPSDDVKEVLSRTMGVPIFQEQAIKLAMVAAGFTGGEADQLRRAMASWKKNGALNKFKEKLLCGLADNGYSEDFAERLYKQILGFGEYGFPESHSASFALLAYVSSWIKRYFPHAFYVSLLNSLPMGFYSSSQLIQDAKRHKMIVKPVCINQSDNEHSIEWHFGKPAIRLGLTQISGLSDKAKIQLIELRPKDGYQNLTQLHQMGLSSNDLQALASANALQIIAGHRYQTRWDLMNTQHSLPLFSEPTVNALKAPVTIDAPSVAEDLVEDYHSLSLSLNSHPIALLTEHIRSENIKLARDLRQLADQSLVKVVGCVTGKQSPGTASGVTFITLEDHTGNMNVIVWRNSAQAQKQPYLKAQILQVNGILERSKDNVVHIVAGKLIDRSDWCRSIKLNSREFR